MNNDLISRQTAIDAIISFFGFSIEDEYGSAVKEVIMKLPSAQPEPCEDAVSRKKMFDTVAEYEKQLCEILGDENELVETVKILKHRLIALPSVQPEPKWIPVSERLPEEHDSIFKKYYGTDKWRNGMFQSSSEKVITTCEFVDGTRFTETNMTCDGKWRTDQYPPRTVIAWMPLPEPYKEET